MYRKPFLNIEQQIELLKERGMLIGNEEKTAQYLSKIGYYRLSGYWYQFRKTEPRQNEAGEIFTHVLNNFRDNTTFAQVVDLYIFDKKLRLLMMDAIERIEIALRTDIALELGQHDVYAYTNASFFEQPFLEKKKGTQESKYETLLRDFDKNQKRSQEDFIRHFRDKYPEQPLPIWVSVETWDIGLLSRMLSGIQRKYSSSIARKYNMKNGVLLASWLRSIAHIRNICAHHGRLWNRSLSDLPRLPRNGEVPLLDHLAGKNSTELKIYGPTAIMCYLLKYINPNSSWSHRLVNLIDAFPIDAYDMSGQTGFPTDWRDYELWQNLGSDIDDES